jgi:endonuclease/exonuclease/phosphatase family metal-dependent hydrolase
LAQGIPGPALIPEIFTPFRHVDTRVKALIFLLLLITPGFAADAEESKPFRVFCWNIHHGVGNDGRLDLPRIAKVIREANPDIVALQEVDKQCTRSGKTDQTAELAKLTGMTGIFGKAMPYQGGEYGQAILSRHPIRHSKVHPLPGGKEPRIAFEALVEIGGSPVRVVSVHLDVADGPRLEQATRLRQILENRATPLVLCGDFNDTPDSPTLAIFGPPWKPVPPDGPGFTIPAEKPTRRIDYFFTKSTTPKGPVHVFQEPIASDHLPLMADFERPEK